VCHRPRAHVVGRRGAAREQVAQLPLGRMEAHRKGPPHAVPRPSDRSRQRADQMNGAQLVLADGETFEGVAVGCRPDDGVATGEVVFNTALAGYQEILTDPSYAGQIITFTYPH